MTEVRSHSARDFPLPMLRDAKGEHTISVCIPARNEEATVGTIVGAIHEHLASNGHSLVDEIIVIDDRSEDGTADVARAAGATVVQVADVLPDIAPGAGKGNVLWKSIAACRGDLIVWIDADLTSFTPACVTGLVGPLLTDPEIAMVKGYYERPEIGGTGGGRTTELMARPLLATLFPHLTSVRQPLGGEYAARRDILEQVPFSMGYGVETGLLIDIAALVGTERLAQVDLGVRVHRNRPLHELSVQAMEILHVALRRAEVEWQDEWSHVLLRPDLEPVEALVDERPPLATVADYLRLR
ncbi:MAG: glucosyl-3-phosphoglycerate synthase [Acidimicrobiales bacterium]|nr:glucosyl-3-phosphoglycerate synthase [Acidimicrobiales bacterium]